MTLENPSGPSLPEKYEQDIAYMRGHPTLIVEGAAADTHISAFSVGRINAIEQSLFKPDVDHDGVADLARLAIESPSGQVASLLLGNAAFMEVTGETGIFAPGVTVAGDVRLHDITGSDNASPMLVLGATPQGVQIAGGNLEQANAQAVRLEGVDRIQMAAGMTSHGQHQAPLANEGQLLRGGVDVTAQVVVNP